MAFEDETYGITSEIQVSLELAGFKSSFISVQCLSDVESDIQHPFHEGTFDETFYRERLAHYRFEHPRDFPTANSIILTAAPQPKVNVEFALSGRTYTVIIPPTYSYSTDERAFQLVSNILDPYGYHVCDAILPAKLLAVHCGLAEYGRNNIAYIDEWGSYFRLKAFYSNLPCTKHTWKTFTLMDHCANCTACLKACPTNALSQDRFIVHAERCLTFLNEGEKPFPEWVEPTWHNCLIGCMVCQDVCPVNVKFRKWTALGVSFSEQETRLILSGISLNSLPEGMIQKLKRVYLFDDYHVLKRNVKVILKKMN